MMTRKDYVMIAGVIARSKPGTDASAQYPLYSLGYAAARTNIAEALANHLAQGNPQFNRTRFLDACGVEK